jgi:putative hydrolase of the HAD superfamily
MIKVIIFDADGVLNHSKRRFSILLAEKYGISVEKTSSFFEGPFQDCLTGDADLKEVIFPYLDKWGWDKGVDALLEYWFQQEHNVDEKIIQYIKELRSRDVLCLLATNNEKYRFQYMLDKMGFSNIFDKTYSSAHMGHKKPEQNFFLKIFKELNNIQKSEVLFTDDSIENIEAAKEFGIHAELYTSLENLKQKIALLNAK